MRQLERKNQIERKRHIERKRQTKRKKQKERMRQIEKKKKEIYNRCFLYFFWQQFCNQKYNYYLFLR